MQYLRFAAVLTVVTFFACESADDPSNPTGSSGDSQASVQPAPPTAVAPQVPTRASEREFVSLAEAVPGFGGAVFDERGDVVVFLKDTSQLQRVLPAVRAMIHGRRRGIRGRSGEPMIIARRGEFGFNELATWRNVLSNGSWPRALHSIGVDEGANRVRLLISEPTAREEVLQFAVRLGVPAEAVVIDVRPVPVPAAYLADLHRPIPGGVAAHTFYQGEAAGACTIGFNAEFEGVRAFVTASHCTENIFGPDSPGNTYWYQNNYLLAESVGEEWIDPNGFTCWDGLGWRECRNSDAVAVRYFTASHQFGYIARTEFARHHEEGSRIIDEQNPTFQLSRQKDNNMTGETLDKIGWAGGWTFGDVLDTCDDKNFTHPVTGYQFRVYCLDTLDAYIVGGDSGGPVFEWRDSLTAELRGIAVGRESGANWPLFLSDLRQIEIDLGPFVANSPGEPENP